MTGSDFCRVTEERTPSLIYGVYPVFWGNNYGTEAVSVEDYIIITNDDRFKLYDVKLA